MAYGQTGSGKTHTIFGSKGDLNKQQLQAAPEIELDERKMPKASATAKY